MRQYATYLFDLDGTLIDTFDLIIQCFKYSLKYAADLTISDDELKSHIGLPLRAQFEKYFIPRNITADYEDIMKKHMEYQLTIWKDYLRLFDGAAEALEGLKNRGARLAVVTSRRSETCLLYMKHFDILKFFEVVCTPESTQLHKPNAEPALWALTQLEMPPSSALFVGDSPMDMQCGESAGCDTCYTVWGHTPPGSVKPLPDYQINSLLDLLEK